MMAKRDKYLRKFNRTKNLDMEYLYKKFRNQVVSEIRGSKNDHYEQYFTKHKSNMKMLWSGIRSIINCKSDAGSNISCLHHDGIKVDESKKMANIFNNVFVNPAHKINEKICCTRKSPLDYLSSKNSQSFFVSPVSPQEIKILINSMKDGIAVGPYSIPIFLLKILSEHISIPFWWITYMLGLVDNFFDKWLAFLWEQTVPHYWLNCFSIPMKISFWINSLRKAKESLLESSIYHTVTSMTLSLLVIKDLRSSFPIFIPKNSQFLKPQNLLQLLLTQVN